MRVLVSTCQFNAAEDMGQLDILVQTKKGRFIKRPFWKERWPRVSIYAN